MDFSESGTVRGGQCSVTPGRETAKLCSAKVVGGAPVESGTHLNREWNHIEFCGILPSRITRAIDERETVVLQGDLRPQLQAAIDRGRMDGGQWLRGVSMAFKRSASQDAALQKLLDEQRELT